METSTIEAKAPSSTIAGNIIYTVHVALLVRVIKSFTINTVVSSLSI